jgi:hypothetical protein
MPKVIIKELDYASGNLTPDEVEVLELMSDQAEAYLDSDLVSLFRDLEKELEKANKDPYKN